MRERLFVLSDTGHWLLSQKDTYFHPLHLSLLRGDITTDEIYPADVCLFYEDIGKFALTGDRLGLLEEDYVAVLSPTVLVGGENFGKGSAREHAPISLKETGIELLVAHSFDQTFRENCVNLGILTSTDLGLVERLVSGEQVPFKEILGEFQGIEREIIARGGLFSYNLARLEGAVDTPVIKTGPRPMTMVEKIVAQHLGNDQEEQVYVQPGDQVFVPLDFRASYEVFTPLMRKLLSTYAPGYPILDPESVVFVSDHFIANVSKPGHPVHQLLKEQEEFAEQSGVCFYANQGRQAEGIIHHLMIEKELLPGQVAAGTDSHSSMWGGLGVLALPVGATAMANSLLTKDTLFTVPQTVKISFLGELAKNSSAKDVILKLATSLPLEEIRGKVIEFDIKNLDWPVDELLVLACMAKELNAMSAIMFPNERVVQYLERKRGMNRSQIETMVVESDPESEYAAEFSVDLMKIEPMVALPGSPSNSVPVSELTEKIEITKAYIGSCVGGKWEDLVRAARILRGKKLAKGIQLFIQPVSMGVLEKAQKEGLLEVFREFGGVILPPNCGACIGQGPGRVEKSEVGISASTRNYPGRMGEGEIYLASPSVVAASAKAGYICTP